MIKAIACVDKNFGLGKKNGLLFNLKADMKFFRETTDRNVVVFGENTFLSLPGQKALKNRVNIVLCPEGHEYEDCVCIHTLEDLIGTVRLISAVQDVFICGGGMLYKSMLPYCDEVLLTKVDAEDKEATVFFPNIDENKDFELIYESETEEENGLKFKFCRYDKIIV